MTIRSLGLLALVFVLIFALQLLVVLLPFQPLDPAWQWRLSNSLINGAPLPLLALALLVIARVFDPEDPELEKRLRRFSRLAVVAALGFLLLLPLQLSAGLRQQQAVGNAQVSRIVNAEKHLAQLRQITARASSNAELNVSLQKLSGPVLGPADLALPLPLLKAQVNAVFDQAQIQINNDRTALPSAPAATANTELLRNSLACLLLATAFAAFGHRAGSEFSLLEEAGDLLNGLLHRPRPRSEELSDADYVRQLSGEEE
jgi:hypothetical protein